MSENEVVETVDTSTPPKVPKPFPRQCGAKRRNGQPCKSPAMENGRCRIHGGKTPGGPSSPHFKTGKHSKYMPKGLADAYNRAYDDPEISSLREELSFIESREVELLKRMSDTPPPWEGVSQLLHTFNSATDDGIRAAALASLTELVTKGADTMRSYERCWSELRELIQEKTKVASTEWKRLRDLKALVPVEEFFGLIGGMVMAIKEVVNDPILLGKIHTRVIEYLPENSPKLPEPQ